MGNGGGGASGSEKQNIIQRFSKKMRQESLSAKQVVQQAKITDVESAIDLVPADALGGPTSWTPQGSEPTATCKPESTVASELPNSQAKAPSADLEPKLADDIEFIPVPMHAKERNRFQALLMEDSSDTDSET